MIIHNKREMFFDKYDIGVTKRSIIRTISIKYQITICLDRRAAKEDCAIHDEKIIR